MDYVGKHRAHLEPLGGDSIEYGVPNGMYKLPEEPYYRININEAWTGILSGEFTTGLGKKRPATCT